ncbi:MAG: hypothetical protein AAFU49_24650, partial [Pseudomonadota bacterium]
ISLEPVTFNAGLYNHRRPHQAFGMKTPAAAFGLAALPEQIPLGRYTKSQRVGQTAGLSADRLTPPSWSSHLPRTAGMAPRGCERTPSTECRLWAARVAQADPIAGRWRAAENDRNEPKP